MTLSQSQSSTLKNNFGSFVMNGGEISNNNALNGAGVFVFGVINSIEDYYLGEFTLNKGLITQNISTEQFFQ